jgi:3-methyladenine DNA glycosylase AlkD
MRRKMLSWSRSNNLWKRRTAIICQLGFKAETDLQLLYACIEPSMGSREFFLQKAIGWALRQYAWTDGAEIEKYVRLNRKRLSALSSREALKNIG